MFKDERTFNIINVIDFGKFSVRRGADLLSHVAKMCFSTYTETETYYRNLGIQWE